MTWVWLALTFADTCQLIWDNMSCCVKQNKERCQQSAPLCHFRGKFPLQCVRQNNLDMLLMICWLISLYYNQVYKQNMSCYIIHLLLPVCPINYLKWSYEIDQKKKKVSVFLIFVSGFASELFKNIQTPSFIQFFSEFFVVISIHILYVSSLLLYLDNVSLNIC